ncbi:MAG: hypothetical protein GX131_19880 [candidate division WS1 bacterium]|jgi:predicted  nucleic acid-binding Zn-ribbon protein|nr:hypothetical protein [candidate division WS1 bacterium]
MTPEDFQRLYELQVVDTGIDERNALISKADDGTSAKAALEAAEARLAELEEQLHQKQAEQQTLELNLGVIEQEKQEKSDRAYGGTVSDIKELSALEKKIAELERNAGRHEDMVLAVLDEVDDLTAQADKQRAVVAELRGQLERIVAHFEQSTAQAREEIEALEGRREELVAEIPEALLKQYEQIRPRCDGLAVAALDGYNCAVCHVAIPRVHRPMVVRGTDIVKCENCRRILVIPEG